MVITILICGMIIFAAIFAVYLGRDMVKHKDTFSDKSVLGLAASSRSLFFLTRWESAVMLRKRRFIN